MGKDLYTSITIDAILILPRSRFFPVNLESVTELLTGQVNVNDNDSLTDVMVVVARA